MSNLIIAGSRSQHYWFVCALEPPRTAHQRVWLRRWNLPVLPLPQPDRLRGDDPGGGHAGHLQARTLHLRRVGIRWSSLLATSRTPHVLPKVMNQKHRFPWRKVSSSYERYEERAKIYLQQVIAQVKHLQFYTEVFLLWESNTILAFPQNGSLGGPIIMTQIENEFGNYGYGDHPRDKVFHSWKND